MKKVLCLSVFCAFFGLKAQNTNISNDTISQIEKQSIQVLGENTSTQNYKLPTSEGLIHLYDDANAQHYDQKWLKELSDKNLFSTLYADVTSDFSYDVQLDELPTELLKQRLELLNQKSPFNIEYNPILERVIKTFLKNRRASLQRLMNISQYYFPMFEQELTKHKIPLEIKYLPIIESALNPKATSRAGAKGLWQFMYYTGKMYGLEVSNYVDERSDPRLATQTAMKFLNRLYDIFGDWDLVLAAYNSGPGNVTKAMRRSGGKNNYWNLRPHLPKETAGYVPAFLATVYIFEYAKEHGFKPEKRENIFFETDTIQVKKHIPFKDIADVTGMSVDEIEFLNPAYSLNVVPYVEGKNYGLRLPSALIGKFVNNEERIYEFIDQRLSEREKPLPHLVQGKQYATTSGKYHKVKKGETLMQISRKYGVSVENLKRWNGLKNSNLKVGQKIVVKR